MDPVERMILRVKNILPETPLWAKAERMERSVPQSELWRYSGKPFRAEKKLGKNGGGVTVVNKDLISNNIPESYAVGESGIFHIIFFSASSAAFASTS